jgi:hypothetical protein
MSAFVLTLFPDGKALLTTEQDLTQQAVRELREMFKAWQETPNGLAVMSARVEYTTSVEIELPEVEVPA